MSYIIVSRNPSNKKVVAIVNDAGSHREHMAEFETEREAEDAAKNTTICKAWGYQILEIE